MDITLNLILTKLFIDNPNLRIPLPSCYNDIFVYGVRLLPHDLTKVIRDDILYVYDESYDLDISDVPSNLLCLQIGEKIDSEIVSDKHIKIKTNDEIAIFLSALYDIFVVFKSWYTSLERTLIEDGSIQKMIDQSEHLINAPFLVYDPSLKIIGKTLNIKTDDRIFNKVVHHGYLPDELVQFFKSEQTFHELNTKGISEADPNTVRDHHDYIILLKSNSISLGHAVLLQGDIDREYQVYLFRTLCDLICDSLKHNVTQNAIYDYLLTDILDKAISNEETVAERIKYIGLKYEGFYTLLLLSFTDENNVPHRFLINTLSNILPDAKVFLYREDILILYPLKDLSKEKYMDQLSSIKSILDEEINIHKLRCAISKSFIKITDICIAYEQCKVALDLCDKDTDFIHYENYWLQHIFSICGEHIPLSSFCEPVISSIASKKKSSSVSPLRILKVYLECDRQLTQCAEVLHMHRNNVLYHISKLTSEYNLNLDDSDSRLKLLISLRIHEYLNEYTQKS